MELKVARKAAGLTLAEMSKCFGIPERTIISWERGERKPPAYVERLVIDKLLTMISEKQNTIYVDEKYEIDENLPKHLLDYINELQAYVAQNDEIGFECLLSSLEGTIKQYRLSGKITERQLDNLFRRYGLR